LIDYYKNDLYFVSQGSSKIFEEEVIVSVLSDVIKKAKFVLDIGAHAGSHSVVYKSLNNSLKIFAFEPQKELFQLLQHNITLNQLEDVEVFNLALGYKAGLATLGNRIHDIDSVFDVTCDPDVLTNLGVVGFGTGGESVQVTTIDDLNLDHCDLKSTQELLADFGYSEIRKIDWMNYLAVGANF
jgi:FkbM family methyltransferase